jgi:hypothetical protein
MSETSSPEEINRLEQVEAWRRYQLLELLRTPPGKSASWEEYYAYGERHTEAFQSYTKAFNALLEAKRKAEEGGQ